MNFVDGFGVHSMHRVVGVKSDVRGGDDLREIDEFAVFFDVFFVFEDIEGGVGDFSRFDAGDEGGSVDDSATGGVDQDDAGLHFFDRGGVDEVFCFGKEWDMEGDDVGFFEDFVEGVGVPKFEFFGGIQIWKFVECDNFHPESAGGDASDDFADFSRADESEGFAAEGDSAESVEIEVATFDFFVGGADAANRGEKERENMLRDDMRTVLGDIADADFAVVGGGEVDVVVADGSGDDEFEVWAVFDDFSGDFRVDENAQNLGFGVAGDDFVFGQNFVFDRCFREIFADFLFVGRFDFKEGDVDFFIFHFFGRCERFRG